MLKKHIKFLANININFAKKYKNNILRSIEKLKYMPERFPYIKNKILPKNKYHKLVVNKRYLVIYQINFNIVFIDYILDCRQGYNWLLED